MNYIAALFKGQEKGDLSPNGRDLKITTSPQDIQTGVTPNYASSEGANDATILYKANIQTASSTSYVEGAVLIL